MVEKMCNLTEKKMMLEVNWFSDIVSLVVRLDFFRILCQKPVLGDFKSWSLVPKIFINAQTPTNHAQR